jgi:hypothetical protein
MTIMAEGFCDFPQSLQAVPGSMWKYDRTVSSSVFCISAYITVGYIASVVE